MIETIGFSASIARNNAGFKQEYAAEALCINCRTLSQYENNRSPIPDDVIVNMINLYNAPWLGYEWLRLSFDTGKKILPELSLNKSLASNALGMQIGIKNVKNIEYELAEICEDNVIDSNEIKIWDSCVEQVNGLWGRLATVILHPTQKETISN